MHFELHSNLASKKFIADLPLCRVLMEDEKHYPWLLLVPRRLYMSRIIDLTLEDQFLLLKEMDLAQKALWDIFKPNQLNVAAIGNKTPQLHIHVIARYHNDPAWPGTVWDHPVRSHYPIEQKELIVQQLQAYFELASTQKQLI